jgi:hypothetical protein
MMAPPATKLAGGRLSGNQFETTVAGSTFRADDVRPFHASTMRVDVPFSIKKKFREMGGTIGATLDSTDRHPFARRWGRL